MKFSICIPTLNEEKYVGGILSCLTKQTFKDFEVIVVDGKSTDKTKGVVLGFKDKLDIKFMQCPKRGVSCQRNYAAKKAKNEYIIFFDADVQIDNDFIEKIREYLEKNDIDILTSWNKPLSTRIDDELLFLFNNFFALELIKKISPGAIGVFICVKRKSFEKIGGFRENINYAEDYDLVKRFFKSGFKYVLLKKPQIKVSVRRLEKEGRVNMTIKQLKAATYYILEGEDFADKIKSKIKHEFGKF
jgi:glycosyltransferase involved in cell wall biosynthesis